MKLSDYLEANAIIDGDFAKLIGVDRSTVARLRGGQIPKQETMLAIHRETGGEVTANDFFGIPKYPPAEQTA